MSRHCPPTDVDLGPNIKVRVRTGITGKVQEAAAHIKERRRAYVPLPFARELWSITRDYLPINIPWVGRLPRAKRNPTL